LAKTSLAFFAREDGTWYVAIISSI
jgi:hypothetical protein